MDIRPGRPRIKVDYDLILSLRETECLGWKRAVEEYNLRTGQKISKDTYRGRYFHIERHKDLYFAIKSIIRECCKKPVILPNDEQLL